MVKKILYVVGIGILPLYLYGQSFMGFSNENDATGKNFAPHIAHQPPCGVGVAYTEMVWHTRAPGGGEYSSFLARYNCYTGEIQWYVLEGSENQAYPTIAMIYWYGEGRYEAVAYLSGDVFQTDQGFDEYVAMGTKVKVYASYNHLHTYVEIPVEYQYAGAPSIVYGYSFPSEGGRSTHVFFITFVEYRWEPIWEQYVSQKVKVWALSIDSHGSVSTSLVIERPWVEGESGFDVHNPSIAAYRHPSGVIYLHLAWEDPGAICYWVVRIPSPQFPPAAEEVGYVYGMPSMVPRFEPHISSYGDCIHLVYRDNEGNPGFIRRSTRDANESDNDNLYAGWRELDRNISEATGAYNRCDWPQGNSNFVTWVSYMEEAPLYPDIYIIEWPPLEPEPNWATTTHSNNFADTFPNIVAYNLWRSGELVRCVDLLWTRINRDGQNVIYFRHYEPVESQSAKMTTSLASSRVNIAPDVPVYYHIKCGDPIPSYYCEKRDGYATLKGHLVDIGSRELIYKLPLLDPRYHYLVRATVFTPQFFPDSSNSVSETFNFDGEKVSLSATSAKPETLDFIIPHNLYKEDRGVRLRIAGEKGAWLEDIKVYQFEVWGQNPPQTQTFQGIASSKSNRLPLSIIITPNVFSSAITIKYQVTNKGEVSLGVYDATGKLVKTLNRARSLKPGIYSVVWNGRDKTGRMLPSGVYFIRLETEGSTLMKKVMLLR